ncbi:MAG: NADH-quinone oxidoreductase subunit NuoK [Deltaproteobacteria bacterium]|nr:MAG: NADH-quinone oxidoreductase subunit NuoK [Deltaproteobacteria bacterium]
MDQVGLYPVLFTSALLFGLGVTGVLTRRNVLIVLMSIELMLNGVNLAFVGFARHLGQVDGHAFAIFVMAVAAAEAAVGLALVLLLFRHKTSVDLETFDLLRG